MGRVREEKRREEKKNEDQRRESQKKEDADARKGRKVAKHCVFPMICGSGGSKSRLAKAAGAEPSGQMKDEKNARRCGAKHISKSKCTKHPASEHFWKLRCHVEKVHAVVARSTFPSQNVQTPQCRSTFGSCDVEKVHAVVARSTFPSQKLYKNLTSEQFGALLEVAMSKKCTRLWREAHFEVKMYKTHQCSEHFWKLTCRKSARRCGAKHISKSKVQKT